ncbi:MAG TPA: hypothetical protein PK079_25545 [Leptospiraceae bacterium]|nr:hypothetical protein [Leptospiraceae bacterium]HMW08470.1 hypothetical protein [Leptospiraceae bacterium]HMX33947.1 hypothetical protein [Leptospiraceae bacterium]HMY34230.1 hypothetical protein [Leptospiraceae bacterium]HMZ66755.1 hypothetical protein [Leptospiraceae bacterium]
MENYSEKVARFLDFSILIGSVIVILAWAFGMPLFYNPNGPVMSIFTAISLFTIVGLRLATKYFSLWAFTINIALLLIVGGGNLSSLLMLATAPAIHVNKSSFLVMTSVYTSIGFIFFSIYEILLYLRKTPRNVFILDDILIHLALVPGELSLIGHLFNNPTYLSMGIDPRVGISILEMFFMAALAGSTVLSNKNLFLWQFLKGGVGNQIIFLSLFANQYIAPLLYLVFVGKSSESYGTELFIMLAGVFATLGFLLIQAYSLNKDQVEA